METFDHGEHIRGLHELVAGSADIKGTLDGLTGFAATAISHSIGVPIDVAVTLRRRKRTATVAGSSEKAVELDNLEQSLKEGPCLEALDKGRPVLLDDVETDTNWPEYSKLLAQHGCRSALGVPLLLGESSEAVLNFFAPAPGLFTDDVIKEAAAFADVAGSTLRLAIRIEATEQLNADLKAAMASRTAIDLACGVIMAQSRISQEEAFRLLTKASSHRNQKLRTVAEEVVEKVAGSADAKLNFED